MAKYHINPTTGQAGACRAKKTCPFGSIEGGHFDTPQEAQAAYEASKKYLPILTHMPSNPQNDPYGYSSKAKLKINEGQANALRVNFIGPRQLKDGTVEDAVWTVYTLEGTARDFSDAHAAASYINSFVKYDLANTTFQAEYSDIEGVEAPWNFDARKLETDSEVSSSLRRSSIEALVGQGVPPEEAQNFLDQTLAKFQSGLATRAAEESPLAGVTNAEFDELTDDFDEDRARREAVLKLLGITAAQYEENHGDDSLEDDIWSEVQKQMVDHAREKLAMAQAAPSAPAQIAGWEADLEGVSRYGETFRVLSSNADTGLLFVEFEDGSRGARRAKESSPLPTENNRENV